MSVCVFVCACVCVWTVSVCLLDEIVIPHFPVKVLSDDSKARAMMWAPLLFEY